MAIVAYLSTDTERTEPMRVDVVDENACAMRRYWYGEPNAEWFYGYVSNQFDPTRYLIRGEGSSEDERWMNAHEWLISQPQVIRDCEITPDIAADYPPEDEFGWWNESGDRLDTEALMLSPCTVGLLFDRRES